MVLQSPVNPCGAQFVLNNVGVFELGQAISLCFMQVKAMANKLPELQPQTLNPESYKP